MAKVTGKRSADAAFSTANDKPRATADSPYMTSFEHFRDELDQHHDRRERIIKASRDITAASKKIVRRTGHPVPHEFVKKREWETIVAQYNSVTSDLQGINIYRYSQNITGGNQEWMEAVSFQYYLETQRLISYDEAAKRLTSLSASDVHVRLSVSDYLLGIFDMVGELMRFSITAMATGTQAINISAQHDAMNTQDAKQKARTVLEDLREVRSYLEMLDVSGSSVARDVSKKMGVMQECVEKVEKASYSQVVRGSERPKGWIPDLEDTSRVSRDDD